MKRITLISLAGILTSLGAYSAAFTNGSFESPGGAPIRQSLGNNDPFVTGWINNGGFQIYESSGQDGINAFDGNYYVSWGHNGATGGTLTQTFDTVIGLVYSVDYLLTIQQGTSTNPQQEMMAQVFDSGVTVLGSQDIVFAPVNGFWFISSFSFSATTTTSRLVFTDLTTSTNSAPVNWGLDNVHVIGRFSATPEPGTLAMLATGLLLAGVIRKRAHR